MKLKKSRTWDAMSVRNMCVREDFYTHGDCADYKQMLDFVESHKEPDDLDIYLVAKNILNHTNPAFEQTVDNIMYILANDVIVYFYEVDLSK